MEGPAVVALSPRQAPPLPPPGHAHNLLKKVSAIFQELHCQCSHVVKTEAYYVVTQIYMYDYAKF